MAVSAVPTEEQQERWKHAVAVALIDLPDPGLTMPSELVGEEARWWLFEHIAATAVRAIVSHETVRAEHVEMEDAVDWPIQTEEPADA